MGKISETPPWEVCQNAETVGEMAVYVTPACPFFHMIHGQLVASKRDCRRCWKENGNRNHCTASE